VCGIFSAIVSISGKRCGLTIEEKLQSESSDRQKRKPSAKQKLLTAKNAKTQRNQTQGQSFRKETSGT
jgi:hypothetical protein